MAEARFKRRKVLVDRKLQVGISATVVLLVASYFVFFCVLTAFLPSLLASSEVEVGDRVAKISTTVVETFRRIFLPLILTFVFLALHVIVLTHRMAGPAFRFRKAMGSIRDGDLTGEIHLREGDFMTDLADEINETTMKLRQDLSEARVAADALAEGSRALASRSTGPAADQANDLAEKAERLCEVVGRYRLEVEPEE